ncbi:MAG TPA: hypothetical protein VLV86_23280 [Vicinamibacterales bacterium]|nr:hypothetical protein [Vicinamibacterales bacterium]
MRSLRRGRTKEAFAILWLATLAASGCTRTNAVSQAPAPDCALAATFADGKTPNRVRHVAGDGSDGTGDGSAARPFHTLGRAVHDLSPGTAIYMHAGAYPGGVLLSDIRGTRAAPVWIAGAPGESRPVIRGGGDGLHFVRPRYLVIQDLEIRDAASNGLNVDDGDDVSDGAAAGFVVLRDLEIHDTGVHPSGIGDCLKLAGVYDVAILHSQFGRCGSGPSSGAVGVGGVGVHRATIAFNRFAANGYGAVQVKGGSDEVEIIGNVVQDAGWRGVNLGGSTGAAFFRPPLKASSSHYEAARIHVLANVFVGGEAAAAFTGCVDCEFSHNTVVDPSKWVVRVLQETAALGEHGFAPASGGRIAGNIFYFRRSDLNTGEDINVGEGTDPASFSLERNLWYAHDAPRRSDPRVGAIGMDTRSIVGTDPQFVNADRGDFHLRRTSVAIGAGEGSTAPPADLDGKCYSMPPSLGAFR